MKCILLIALLSAANVIATTNSFQPQVIKGRIIEEETGDPISHCIISARNFFFHNGIERSTLSRYHRSSLTGEFVFTNLSEQVTRCEIELMRNNQYQMDIISGPFEPGTNDWGTIELKKRPFYSENCRIQDNELTATVVNTTERKAYMRFWLTAQLTRLDDSEYLGSQFTTLLKLKKRKRGYKNIATYRLVPGENQIKLRVKDYGPDISISRIMLNGGRSSLEPMMIAAPVFNFIPNPLPRPITNLPPVIILGPLPTNLPPLIIPAPFPTNSPPLIPWPPISPPYTTFSGSMSSSGSIGTGIPPLRITP